MIIFGEDEFEKKTLSIKNLHKRQQESIPANNLIDYFKSVTGAANV